MKKAWLSELDIFRGFAILGVIAIHSFALPPSRVLEYYTNYQQSPFINFICQILLDYSRFAVPLFILVSGIALAYKYCDGMDVKDFYVKRLLKIIPPYIIISLVSIFSLGLISQMPSAGTIIFKLLTGSASGPLWFIIVILQLYVLFPFLLTAILMWQRESSFFIIFPVIALLIQLFWALLRLVLTPVLPFEWVSIIIDRLFIGMFFYFVCGIYFGLYYKEILRWIKSLPIFVPIVLSLSLYLAYILLRDNQVISAFLSISFIFNTIILIIRISLVIAEQDSWLRSFIQYMGTISFGVYLIHPFFNYIFWISLSGSSLTPSSFLYYPLMFSLLILSSILTIRILLKIPYHKWLIGI